MECGQQCGFTGTREPSNSRELAKPKVHVEAVDGVRVHLAQRDIPVSRARFGLGRGARAGQGTRGRSICGVCCLYVIGNRARVHHLAAALTGERADVHDPIGVLDQLHIVLHQQHRIALRDEATAHVEHRTPFHRMQARRGLIQDIGHAIQPGAQLRGQAQALHLTTRERFRRPIQAEVPKAEFQCGFKGRKEGLKEQVFSVIRLRLLGFEELVGLAEREGIEFVDRQPGVGDLERLRRQPAPLTGIALAGFHETQDAGTQRIRLRLRIGLGQVAGHGAPRALVIALDLIRPAARLDGHHRAFLGEEDPLAVLLRQLLPRRVQVIAQLLEDVVEVLARPGPRPGGNGPLLDAQAGVRHHGGLRGLMHHAGALALRAHALRGIRGKGIGVQALRVVTTARVKQAHGIRHGGDRAHGGARAACRRRLLQRHRRRQPLDAADLRVHR